MANTKTPLRYPGGKQRLAPFVAEVLQINNLLDGHYVEPYAGGAGAALELLFRKQVGSIHLNDSSRAIYAFWHSVLNHTDRLCDKITSASLTVQEWRHQQQILRNPTRHNLFDVGFSTLFLNRVNRSGILSAGLIGGLAQNGNYKMDARFSRSMLLAKIQGISQLKKQISLTNLDAEEFLQQNINKFPKKTLIYFDPPYFVKGGDLYLNSYSREDHIRLAEAIQKVKKVNWILSYDAADEILSLYNDRKKFVYGLQYHAAERYEGSEVFIFSDNTKVPETSALRFINTSLYERK